MVKNDIDSTELITVEDFNRRNKLLHELHIKYGYLKGQRPKNSKHKRLKIYEENKGLCAYCGKKLAKENFHLEHKIPLARGGNNEYENLTISCADCNARKGTKTSEEFLEVISNEQ